MQTVLITGASEGMGLSAAKLLSFKGANVVLISRSVEKLEDALKIVQVNSAISASILVNGFH